MEWTMTEILHERVLRLDCISHAKMKSLDPRHTLVVATLSPLEVHGPHLPLGQDMFEAYAIAEQAMTRIAGLEPTWTIVLLPPVPVAADCVPQLGSVNFPVEIVRNVAYHLLEPFAKKGFSRLAYSSFHGGPRHICALEDAAEALSKRYSVGAACLFSIVLSRLMEGDTFFAGIETIPERQIDKLKLKQDHHAGMVETSLALHLWPQFVEDGWQTLPGSVAVENVTEEANDSFLYGYQDRPSLWTRTKRTASQAASMYRSVKHFNVHTYFGYPAMASAAQGEALFEHLLNITVEAVQEFLAKGTEMNVHSPLWKGRRLLLSPMVNKVANDWLKIYVEE
ncbi:MAG: hypothetical protein C4523_04280 [Myxococcales bacterium]|nr:MAG: hypothetical protein C4523_04280 [Myxococcales bacterium]